eukprot:m.307120 g.307120  ORF g.307120 m.307120 type:complete len:574 (-) comp19728_c0_seq1:203-1924(-)
MLLSSDAPHVAWDFPLHGFCCIACFLLLLFAVRSYLLLLGSAVRRFPKTANLFHCALALFVATALAEAGKSISVLDAPTARLQFARQSLLLGAILQLSGIVLVLLPRDDLASKHEFSTLGGCTSGLTNSVLKYSFFIFYCAWQIVVLMSIAAIGHAADREAMAVVGLAFCYFFSTVFTGLAVFYLIFGYHLGAGGTRAMALMRAPLWFLRKKSYCVLYSVVVSLATITALFALAIRLKHDASDTKGLEDGEQMVAALAVVCLSTIFLLVTGVALVFARIWYLSQLDNSQNLEKNNELAVLGHKARLVDIRVSSASPTPSPSGSPRTPRRAHNLSPSYADADKSTLSLPSSASVDRRGKSPQGSPFSPIFTRPSLEEDSFIYDQGLPGSGRMTSLSSVPTAVDQGDAIISHIFSSMSNPSAIMTPDEQSSTAQQIARLFPFGTEEMVKHLVIKPGFNVYAIEFGRDTIWRNQIQQKLSKLDERWLSELAALFAIHANLMDLHLGISILPGTQSGLVVVCQVNHGPASSPISLQRMGEFFLNRVCKNLWPSASITVTNTFRSVPSRHSTQSGTSL